ncbi:hypothetical protein Glove_276g19 [Diversispora epigaea]|uniref:BTB domain-containing protein n=1 Tax=Diversispora epigaea TaxID=1348612 RepID=A0A397IAV5_9GLOM|nr:hypothetical protein Glove_276g19 [Diversispora epigaea]
MSLKLSQNFIELLNDKDDYNVIIEVENNEKSLTAHSSVLKYRASSSGISQPNENNIKIINKPSVSTQIFNVILYIYGGIVNLENTETRFIYDLMLITDEFKLEELTNRLETFLIKNKSSWLRTHFSFIYNSIFSRNSFKKLENFCNDIVVKYPNLIFGADDLISLKESALVSLIKRDDLRMKEIRIWDYTIKWEPRLFMQTLISVLVTELPPRTNELKEIFSTIISEDHAAEISVVVVKVKGTDEIIGGYNPLTWDNTLDGKVNKWMEIKNSFIFSLKNGNTQNSILSRVKNTYIQLAILNSKSLSNNFYEKPIRTLTYCFSMIITKFIELEVVKLVDEVELELVPKSILNQGNLYYMISWQKLIPYQNVEYLLQTSEKFLNIYFIELINCHKCAEY